MRSRRRYTAQLFRDTRTRIGPSGPVPRFGRLRRDRSRTRHPKTPRVAEACERGEALRTRAGPALLPGSEELVRLDSVQATKAQSVPVPGSRCPTRAIRVSRNSALPRLQRGDRLLRRTRDQPHMPHMMTRIPEWRPARDFSRSVRSRVESRRTFRLEDGHVQAHVGHEGEERH